MTALSIKNRGLYDRIGSKEISLSEFTTFLKKLIFNKGERYSFQWAALLYLGAFGDQPPDKLEQEFQELGVWDSSGKEEGDFRSQFDGIGKAFSMWGDLRGDVFSKIYENLEGLRTFAED